MRRELAWMGMSAGVTLALALVVYGCGHTSSGTCADNGTCATPMDASGDESESAADGGTEGAADGATDASADADSGDGYDGYACDPTKLPSQDPCVIDDSYGVFVSPAGRAGAAGTKSDPFLRVADAIVAATGHTDRVLACAGTYNESLILGTTLGADAGTGDEDSGSLDGGADAASQGATPFAGGVTVFGGLDCANGWKYTGAKAILAPQTRGTALTVKGLVVGLTFQDFGFHSLSAVLSQESSIAVFASESAAPGLTLIRCDIVAGSGQPGVDQTGVMGFDAGAPGGSSGTATSGGGITPTTCGAVAMASVGGAGGQPAAMGSDGQDGTPGPSNKGTAAGCAANNLGGGPGANGAAGGAGSGALSWAMFDQNGWVPSMGAFGGPGGVGQGGGGGGSVDNGGGGSGGGAGGRGGTGGAGGTGGGLSIAVLVYQSSVDIEECTITTAIAGGGGNGAAGQTGQLSGPKGPLAGTGCSGGKGGSGGSGGGGGGGAGGLSVGVLWSGSAPVIDGSPVGQANAPDAGGDGGTLAQVSVGSPGAAGMHGTGGSAVAAGANPGTDGTDGKPGVAAAVMQFQ